jgi:hypothetical protein
VVIGAVQAQAQALSFTLDAVGRNRFLAQLQLWRCVTQPTCGQAPFLTLAFEQVSAALQAFQAQRFLRGGGRAGCPDQE